MRTPLYRAFALVLGLCLALALAPSVASADEPVVTAQADGRININTASASELTALKGIGKKKAQAIVDYRTANGPYASVDAPTGVKGIGKKTVEKLRDQITVGDGEAVAPAPTPAPEPSGASPGNTTDAVPTPPAAPVGDLININTASAAELMSLRGIGKGKAAKIIEYREANGPFASVDDLTNVKGIGKKTVEKFRAQITVGGE